MTIDPSPDTPSSRGALVSAPTLPSPYLLYLGDTAAADYAKTAFGLRDWAPEKCLGQHRRGSDVVSLGLPDMTPAQAVAAGARAFVIGLANAGGFIPDAWRRDILLALEAGLHIVSGMHMHLDSLPDVPETAARLGRQLIDVRRVRGEMPLATGRRRTGKRLLAVGTDCALGKMYTALCLTRALKERGVPATFRASGQTGIMIAGEGVPIDAVVSDFVAGAAEILSPDNDRDHWDVVEGQGSLFHPAFAAVSLGLLHGSQPDAIVMCHEPTRTEVKGFPGFPLPAIDQAIAQNIAAGRVTNPRVQCVGVSLNTSRLPEEERDAAVRETEQRFGLPCADPMRDDLGPILDRLERI